MRIWRSTSVIHTKVLVVDDDFVSLGSYNFDHRSLAYNLEVVVNVLDRAYSAEVQRMLEGDMEANTELTLLGFERRSIFARLLERLAYSLRKWL